MTKKVDFTYFLDGKNVNKSDINWDLDITIKVEGNIVFVKTKTPGYLSTRHKKPPGN